MKAVVDLPNREVEPALPAEPSNAQAEAILQELDRILASRYFRSAGRSRQFLQYVVHEKLAGRTHRLKERTIGAEVFQRSPDYATGDDPVVRVQAGEVRRRLEQYYQESPSETTVSIKLPLGSYAPMFEWAPDRPGIKPQHGHMPVELVATAEPTPALLAEADTVATLIPSPPEAKATVQKPGTFAWRWEYAATLFLVGACITGFMFSLQRPLPKKTPLEQFWSPVFTTVQPVLICLAKPVVYRPSKKLYDRYTRMHPGTFTTEVERYNHVLPLDPDEKLAWSDMAVYPEYGVALGDAYASVSLSGLLGQIGKPGQVRIGSGYSFEDLRNSPAIVVGAFNNRWTMNLTANLHFAFVENNGKFAIQEQIPGGRTWKQYAVNSAAESTDFAIVGRILDSRTGQFIVIVAGIDGTGTQAAAEFVSHADYIEKGLRDAPEGWEKKNMEVVLQTTITDSIGGPPKVVAAYYW